MLLGDENTEDAGPITAGDIALVAGGALPLFVPLELLGMGEAGVIAGIAGGLLAFVYGKKIKQFAYDHAPAFQSPEEMKKWLLSRPGEVVEDDSSTTEASDEEELIEGEDAGSDEQEDTNQDEPSTQSAIVIPKAPKFPEMCHLLTEKRLVLCWTEKGPVYGTITDLLSMVIIGKPGRGKTTALMYYVAMLLKADAEVHVWDPHGSMSELDGMFADLHYTDDLEDIPDSIAALRTELEERRLLYKRTKQVRRPLLLLVDELPVIGEYNKSLTKKGVEENHTPVKLISDFVLQARKWNCYFIGAGQSTDADVLPTRVTENLSSRIVFYSSNRRATMAGIDLETAKKFLPILKPDDDECKGKMIFDCSRLSESILGAIPYITVKDIQQFLGASVSSVSTQINTGNASVNTVETAPQAERDNVVKDVFPVSRQDTETQISSLDDVLPQWKLEMIRNMKEMNYSDRDIAALVKLTGRKYKLYRVALAQLGYQQKEEI